MTPSLVERLRNACIDWDKSQAPDGAEPITIPTCGDLREAADALEALTRERDEAREQWELWRSLSDKECERAEAAEAKLLTIQGEMRERWAPGHTDLMVSPEAIDAFLAENLPPKFKRGDRVRKIKGSNWQGLVVGEYSSSLTAEGYVVESEREPGSSQLYPAAALELVPEDGSK